MVLRRRDRPGFGHIAFAVDSVSDARSEVLAAVGEGPIGAIVTLTTRSGRRDFVVTSPIPRPLRVCSLGREIAPKKGPTLSRPNPNPTSSRPLDLAVAGEGSHRSCLMPCSMRSASSRSR